MAILASAQWWVRAGGNALNGGGYDAAISGAGTNYCDQDAAQLSLTDFATSGAGSTTLTSATGGFTSQMVGNCIRIASGTNFQTGYYFVTGYTDTNTVTLDRTPTSGGAGSGGTGRLGGAFATPWGSLATGGTTTAPTITSPLAAGHTVWIRGAGDDPPASVSYTMPTGYTTYPSGSLTVGLVRFVGYNGRPRIDIYDAFAYAGGYQAFENLMFQATVAGSFPTIGSVYVTTGGYFKDCTFEAAGFDRIGIRGADGTVVVGSRFQNSGSSSAGSHAAIKIEGAHTLGGLHVVGCSINGWRGSAIDAVATPASDYGTVTLRDTVIAHCRSASLPSVRFAAYTGAGGGRSTVANCSIYGSLSDGLSVTSLFAHTDDTYVPHMTQILLIYNNVFADNGGYGLRVRGTAAGNALFRKFIDHNAFYNNTSGECTGISAGDNDITLTVDPFTNAAGGDFTLNSTPGGGGDIDDTAFPTSIP